MPEDPTSPRRSSTARLAAGLLRTRWLVRAPIWAYRARLGILFGRRLLMLEHLGRSSGLRRYVVLEVVDRTPGHYVVVSGFGERAQWFRNVQANPRVRIWVGSRGPRRANARRMGTEEAAHSLERYAVQHPRAWARLAPVLESTLGARIDAQGTNLPMVDLELDADHA